MLFTVLFSILQYNTTIESVLDPEILMYEFVVKICTPSPCFGENASQIRCPRESEIEDVQMCYVWIHCNTQYTLHKYITQPLGILQASFGIKQLVGKKI